MKIKLLCLGKTSEDYLRKGIQIYSERLRHFTNFEIVELPDIKTKGASNIAFLKEKEAEMILKNIKTEDILILLDENGTHYRSEEFSSFIDKCMAIQGKNIVFVVGGAYGFSETLTQKARFVISLSKMTFTHQMVRLFFVEQLYRAFAILRNLPYHNV